MTESSDDGKEELKAAVVSKIMQLLRAETAVASHTRLMQDEIWQACLPDIVRNHILDQMASTRGIFLQLVERQVKQLRDAAMKADIEVSEVDLVLTMRGPDEQPPEVDLPPQAPVMHPAQDGGVSAAFRAGAEGVSFAVTAAVDGHRSRKKPRAVEKKSARKHKRVAS